MKKVLLSLAAIMVLSITAAIAQPGFYNIIKVTSGNLKFLKGQPSLRLAYEYDGMLVGDMKEEDYMKRRIGEMNKAKSGSGEEWAIKWVNDRMNRFEPNFEKFFIKRLTKAGITASKGVTDSKYTVIIKTVTTEPGLYTGVSFVEKNTFVSVYAIFVETANPDTELCRIYCEKMQGDAGDFASYDTGARIAAAYSNLGNRLGSFVVKTLKKIK